MARDGGQMGIGPLQGDQVGGVRKRSFQFRELFSLRDLDHLRTLRLELSSIPVVGLFPAVFETGAFVVLG
jgi:hypothetical protein